MDALVIWCVYIRASSVHSYKQLCYLPPPLFTPAPCNLIHEAEINSLGVFFYCTHLVPVLLYKVAVDSIVMVTPR